MSTKQLFGEKSHHHKQRAGDDDGCGKQTRTNRSWNECTDGERTSHEQQGEQKFSALQFEIPEGERAVGPHVEKRDDAGLKGCEAQNGETSAPRVA